MRRVILILGALIATILGFNQALSQNLPELHTYFWFTTGIIGNATKEDELIEELLDLKIKVVYFSFNGNQINKFLKTENGQEQLRYFISKLHDNGIEIQLLLGENTWVYPENRGKLLEIVRLFNQFNDYAGYDGFAALHLDVEPHSLPEWNTKREQLIAYYLDTLKEVKKIATKPVIVDISPKYDEIKYQNRRLTIKVLKEVDGINSMCYSTKIAYLKKKARRYSKISSRKKKPIYISISVEKSLPETQSFFKKPKKLFQRALEKIGEQGIKAVAIQNFTDFRQYMRE